MSVAKLFARVAPLALVALAASAEPRFCMGGNLDQLTPQQMATCQQQLVQLRVVAAMHHSPDWHYVLVCDEQAWKDYAAFSNTSEATLAAANADTNIAQKTTFVRGSRLNGSLEQVFGAEVTSIAQKTAPLMAMNR